MELSLDSLHSSGAFMGGPIKRTIDWPPGEDTTMDVYIKRVSYACAVEVSSPQAGMTHEEALVLHCVTDANGKPIFSKHHFTGLNDDGTPVMSGDKPRGHLDPRLISLLAKEVGEVNSPEKLKGEKVKSGTS